jgi:glucose/arabinose dehydrogenase
MTRGTASLFSVTVVAVATMCSSLSVAQAPPRKLEAKVYKSGLKFPVDLAWVPGTKKLFFTEKTGRIRVLEGRRLLGRPCANLDVNASGERGALGIALHPRFKDNRFLYVYYRNASPLENRVTRFEVCRNRCRRAKHVVRGIPKGPDGCLYWATVATINRIQRKATNRC